MMRVVIYACVLIVTAMNVIAAEREDREAWDDRRDRDDWERRGDWEDRGRREEGRIIDRVESICRRHDVELEELMDFYEAEAPEILEAVKSAIDEEDEDAIETVMEAIERYVEYRELSAHDPTLANRWLNYHRGEYRSWKIGDDIRNLREQARRDGTLAQVEPKLREMEATLRRLLAELFEQKQTIQQNEVRQLKAELVEMRFIIEKRAAKREQILERRFAELSGNEEELEW
ncbi:MAG TPA: hypothetical protein DIT01_17765 [Lentisphaeria bacterium]|nr:hypothetical protein [Lentisphaeria bacterium]|tara:strand:+ start:2132 stop:2827 length:696 start_codon:yes stop_codon:yes gene_type:complete